MIKSACPGFVIIQLRCLCFELRMSAFEVKGVWVKVNFSWPCDGAVTGFRQFEKRNLA